MSISLFRRPLGVSQCQGFFSYVSAVDKNKGTSITWEAGLWRIQTIWSPNMGSTVFIMTLVKMLDVFKAIYWSKFLCN